jgi:hypothetical protein
LSYKTRQLLHFEAFLNFGEGVRAVALINRLDDRRGLAGDSDWWFDDDDDDDDDEI